jgi:hypothetical protein
MMTPLVVDVQLTIGLWLFDEWPTSTATMTLATYGVTIMPHDFCGRQLLLVRTSEKVP